MAAAYALSWNRPRWAAEKLGKPFGRGISHYHSSDPKVVETAAVHINSLCPEMECKVEVFR